MNQNQKEILISSLELQKEIFGDELFASKDNLKRKTEIVYETPKSKIKKSEIRKI